MLLPVPDLKIAFQPPLSSSIRHYNRFLPSTNQPASIPQTFRDSMLVRETVFVHELAAIPLHQHMDTDDARSCHWVLYSGDKAVGTVRLVPSPHHLHPKAGESFFPPPETEVAIETADEALMGSPPRWKEDRVTSLHDGKELYIKLGRLSVVKEARGSRAADLLIQAALKWASENPEICAGGREGWKGLVCVHAHEKAKTTWGRNGFVEDEGMGRWLVAGWVSLGMFYRVEVRNGGSE